MDKNRNAIIAIVVVILIGVGVAFAGSQGSSRSFGLPVFGLLVVFAYVVQWLVFIPSFQSQTEKYFDLTGSLTYISLMVLALFFSKNLDLRALLAALMVMVWAARLGTFLARRVHKAGKDERFDDLKPSFWRFLNVWTIQGLWVTFTASAALITITTFYRKPMDVLGWIGLVVWLVGFVFEVVADTQKSRFKADPANRGKFIQSGLWAKSRHPNYFGEIVLWVGVALLAVPVLQGWQWVGLISPLFVTLLLTRVSGVPLLEKRADEKWGGQEDYEKYKKETPTLIPKLF